MKFLLHTCVGVVQRDLCAESWFDYGLGYSIMVYVLLDICHSVLGLYNISSCIKKMSLDAALYLPSTKGYIVT